MGTRGLGPVTELLLGSVARHVVGGAPVPVTLVDEQPASAYAEQFYIEHKGGVWRDDTGCAPAAIPEIRRNDERALAVDLHAGNASGPSP